MWLTQWQYFHVFIQVLILYNHISGIPHSSTVSSIDWHTVQGRNSRNSFITDSVECYCGVIFSAPPFPDPTWFCRLSWTSSQEFTWPHYELGHLTYSICKKKFLPTPQINFQKKNTELIWFAVQWQTSGLMKRVIWTDGLIFSQTVNI